MVLDCPVDLAGFAAISRFSGGFAILHISSLLGSFGQNQ